MKTTMGGAAGQLGGEKKDSPSDAKPQKSKKMRTGEMHIRRGHAGGYIVKNHLEDEDGNSNGRPQEYPMTSLNQVVKHLRAHMPSDEAKAAASKETPTDDQENC